MNNREKLLKAVLGLYDEVKRQMHEYDCSYQAIENVTHQKVEEKDRRKFQPFLTRNQIRQIILAKLDYADRHAVYIMIDRLLGLKLLLNNPTSQLSAQKRIILPTNDTRYFLNVILLQEFIKANYHTHTTLDAFNSASQLLDPESTSSSF